MKAPEGQKQAEDHGKQDRQMSPQARTEQMSPKETNQ
jgi:hypothetical protein